MPAGRTSKFNKKTQGQVLFLASKGFTDKETAKAIGITEQTINNWKKAHCEFFESLKEIKAN